MNNIQLNLLLNKLMKISNFVDYAPNGLQVEGKKEINKIVTGVTACQELLESGVKLQADAIIVHHGYFWKTDDFITISGINRNRLKILLENDINLYSYHLPLDVHPVLGNNTCLAQDLKITPIGMINQFLPHGEFNLPITIGKLINRMEKKLERAVTHVGDSTSNEIKTIAWCTGRGQNFIKKAIDFGVDAFISGEISEETMHISREAKLNFFAAGHHATERGGIKSLGNWLKIKYNFDVTFVDIPNPA